MKKTLSILLGLVMLAGVVVAQENNEVNNNAKAQTTEELYLQMIQGLDYMPSSLADFMVTDIYAIKGRCLYHSACNAGSISALSQLTQGMYGEYLPVFEAIYQHIVNLVPGCYMDANCVEHFALATVYLEYITTSVHCLGEFNQFFMKREAEAGEQSMKARILNLLNNDPMFVARLPECYAIKAELYNNFGGLTRKDGKFVFAENN